MNIPNIVKIKIIMFDNLPHPFIPSIQDNKPKLLGKGSHGQVYLLSSTITSEKFAYKVSWKYDDDNDHIRILEDEIMCLKELKHPNIINVRSTTAGIYNQKQFMGIILDYYPMNLNEYILRKRQKGETLSLQQIRYILSSILKGMEYCHSKGYLHLDLKPANILIHNHKVCLCDFGLCYKKTGSQPFNQYKKSTNVYALCFRPLEIILQNKYFSEKVESWAIGCILIYVVTGRIIFWNYENDENKFNTTIYLQHVFHYWGVPTLFEINEGENWHLSWPTFTEYCDQLPEEEEEGGGETHHTQFGKYELTQLLKKKYNHKIRREYVRELQAVLGEDGIHFLKSLMAYDPLKRLSPSEALYHCFLG